MGLSTKKLEFIHVWWDSTFLVYDHDWFGKLNCDFGLKNLFRPYLRNPETDHKCSLKSSGLCCVPFGWAIYVYSSCHVRRVKTTKIKRFVVQKIVNYPYLCTTGTQQTTRPTDWLRQLLCLMYDMHWTEHSRKSADLAKLVGSKSLNQPWIGASRVGGEWKCFKLLM